MARGKQTCQSTGEHQMSEFKVTRKNKKTKVITITRGVRCKWCKKAEGRFSKENINA